MVTVPMRPRSAVSRTRAFPRVAPYFFTGGREDVTLDRLFVEHEWLLVIFWFVPPWRIRWGFLAESRLLLGFARSLLFVQRTSVGRELTEYL